MGAPTVPQPASVLHVISSTDRRGAETFAVDLHRALAGRGRSSEVVALTHGRAGGARLDVPTLGASRFSGLRQLRRMAKHHDVVVGHGSSTLPACAIALVGTVTPFVYRSIGSPRDWSSTPTRRLRVTAFLRRADRVVAIWRGAADAFAADYRVAVDKLSVIPNGRPGDRFPLADPATRARARARVGIPADATVVLFLGAMSEEKGPELAAAALALRPELFGWFVGDGPVAPSVERGRVDGATDDPASTLAAADVVVLPSRTEGLPAVAIEAGLVGLPVVATDVGGTSEIVVDGVTGVLVPPGDPEALAAGLDRALAAGERLGAAARERCLARFELGVVVDQWERLLDDVGRRGRRSLRPA
jgi:glycosyltransferase involved in cell wall biosynthesis